MKHAKNHIAILFLVFSFINLVIYIYRDKFSYHKYGTYSSLYSADTTKWKKFVDDYPKRELAEARAILDSVHINYQATPDKVLQIGKLLYNLFHRQLGHSSEQLTTASPLRQYKILLSSDTVQLWCGNFAAMFAFFCWSEGIACRVIEIMNPGDHHVLNECYLPEKGQWAVTDLTNNNLLLFDTTKNIYANLITLRDSSGLVQSTLQASDPSIDIRPFDRNLYHKYFGNKNPIYYYYRINNSSVYARGEKIKRYFFPEAWFEEVSARAKGNISFYVKQLFILLWLISLILLIQQLVSSKGQKS
ncbi:MAG TPA: transglutaminase domain-containing protein [Chitinophagaceae bacterium]|nr:transglutaminase domain-containing protein [Chitinophagaceae bacterium]